jgi:hypothetical protein
MGGMVPGPMPLTVTLTVRGGGTIIAKNRDRCPLASGLKVFVPQDGYR